MVRKLRQMLTFGKLFSARFALGGLVLVAATVVSASGVASAQSLNDGDGDDSGIMNVMQCKDPKFLKEHNLTYDKCVSLWNNGHHGHGYGNGHHHHHHHRHHWSWGFFSDWWNNFF